MIRCNNCGWSNDASTIRCEKCNAPLKGSIIGQPNQQAQNTNPDPVYMPATEMGKEASGGFWDQHNVAACPHCGYPNSNEATHCIKCKKPIKGNIPDMPKQPDEPIKPKIQNIEKAGKNIRIIEGEGMSANQPLTGTIDPYRQKKQIKFFLEPVLNEENKEGVIIECHGTTLNLNRESLDPGNNSITSKTQAVITNQNGAFYIQDKSQMQTTFIQANKPFKLENGDIVLMGDRKFRFYIED